VVLVVAHAGAVHDEIAHPGRGPQPGGIPECLRPALERTLEIAQLGRAELRWTASALGLAQAAHSGLFKLPRPAADRLAMYTHFSRDFGLAESLSEQSRQSRRLHPPLLQGSEIPPHTRWIIHTSQLSKNRHICHYLIQNSIVSGFVHSGILERERLRRIGEALGSRYVLLPGVAQFDQTIIDRFETIGVKVVRARVTTLRLWLPLWDTQTGHNLWEATGEVTLVSQLLRVKETVPLDAIAKSLWLRMIQDDLLGGHTNSQVFFRN